MTAIASKTFDYSLVTKEDKGQLIYFAAEIRKAKEAHAAAIIETGRLLSEAQTVMANHSGGTFCEWLDKECGLAKRTAYNYISAFEQFGSCATVAQLEPSAMYALAENESAKKAALKLAAKGQTITQKIARELVKEAKEREPVAEPPSKSMPTPKEQEATTDPTETPGEPCPNCGCTIWTEDVDGLACSECSHPFGESTDAPPGTLPATSTEAAPKRTKQEDIAIERSKLKKTAEALQRSIDDLHRLQPNKDMHDKLLGMANQVIQELPLWK